VGRGGERPGDRRDPVGAKGEEVLSVVAAQEGDPGAIIDGKRFDDREATRCALEQAAAGAAAPKSREPGDAQDESDHRRESGRETQEDFGVEHRACLAGWFV
jgi:hypothetical protein